MILTEELLKDIAKTINDTHRRMARTEDYKRFLMFNGSTEAIIKEAISKEYSKPETVETLSSRVIPINFTGKIISKLAGCYIQRPIRRVVINNTSDSELLELYVEKMCLDQRMKEANRYFKLFKRNLMEFYVDEDGMPFVRNLPRHTYEVLSFSNVTPNKPDVVIKIVEDDKVDDKQVLQVWTAESVYKINGRGNIIIDENNPNGVNPYKKLPFVYINESSYSVDPIPDDDLMRMSIAIPVILTDLCWAAKMQSNSIIWTLGEVGTISSAPDTVVAMTYGPDGQKPEIGQLKPEVDTDKVLTMVQTLVALLLSTKNLSVGTVKANLTTDNAASGISKMLDSAESVEDKKDQQEYFEKAEKQMWKLIKENLIPVWRKQNLLQPDFNKEFSRVFEIDIYFTEPKVMFTEQEQIETSKLRLESGFSTLRMELAAIYPQLSADQVEELEMEIEEDKKKKSEDQIEEIDGLEMQTGDEEMGSNSENKPGSQVDSFSDVRKETLNGAQITAVVEMVQLVSSGLLPREAAKNILITGFALPDAEADRMLGSAGKGFKISKTDVLPKAKSDGV
jgi:hypothetical protein